MTGRMERMAPLSGALAAVFFVAGFLLWGSQPEWLDKPDKIASYFQDDAGRLMAGTYVDLVGVALALWFAGVLRGWLRSHDAGSGRIANTAFGGLVAAGACFLAADAVFFAAAARANDDNVLNPVYASTMFDTSNGLAYIGASFGLGVAFAATAVAAFRHAALPRWLAFPTAVLAVLLLSPMSWIGVLISIPWLLVTSVYLYRAMAPAPATASPPAPTATPTAV